MTGTTTSVRDDVTLAGIAVRRIGYGTMQLTGPGHWFHPDDMDLAKRALRRAVDLGVNHLDTADAYGPETAEHLVRKALYPYPPDLLVATKGGLTRHGPDLWAPLGRPEYLRQCVVMSLRRLQVEAIDLYYLHRIDPQVPLADQLGLLADCQREGKIRHIGLSKVTVDQLTQAQQLVDVAAVQNKHSVAAPADPGLVEACRTRGIPFVPYAPLGAGALTGVGGPRGATPAQCMLAWLLAQGPHVLPIPGSASLQHIAENVAVTGLDVAALARHVAATVGG